MNGARLAVFRALLDGARLGAQFPDATKWKALCELLARGGPRGKPLHVTLSRQSGLLTPRSLAHLHRLQFVAREFFEKHRTRPSKEARAFSMALAALELPPVTSTSARLIARTDDAVRLQVVHEQLLHTAVRLTLVVEQRGARTPISLGRDQLATPSPALSRALALSTDSAGSAWLAAGDAGLTVHEVVRGELGPLLPLPHSDEPCARAALHLRRPGRRHLERHPAAALGGADEEHHPRRVGAGAPHPRGAPPRARAAPLRHRGARGEGEGARGRPRARARCVRRAEKGAEKCAREIGRKRQAA